MTSDLDVVLAAAKDLEIKDRGDRWTHLSLCVLDSVFSIGVKYGGTSRTCRTYGEVFGLKTVLAPAADVASGKYAAQEESVLRLTERAGDPKKFADQLKNHQLTSASNGILKTDAAGQFATVLAENGVERLADVDELLEDLDRLAVVESALGRIRGAGIHGIRPSYLWMLAGSDDRIKPDRMVLRWLSSVLPRNVGVAEAKDLVVNAAGQLDVTPWQLDHAIWRAARGRN